MKRVITYIDGFNLYFGMMDAGLGDCRWLNVQALAQRLLKVNQQLVGTKYFTARISNPPDKRKRQVNYLEALNTLNGPNFGIFYGRYQDRTIICHNCHNTYVAPQEKMTDVNIAVEMIKDAFQDNFDTAMLISGDADLTAPIEAIKRLFADKRIIVALPPARFSYQLKTVAHGYFSIKPEDLRQSQFPAEVVSLNGFTLKRPPKWV